MERRTHGRTKRTGLAGALAAGLVLTSCGLTGPNTSSTKQTTATTRKSGTSFPTVQYVPTTTTTTTTLASVNPPVGGGTAGGTSNGDVAPTPETPGSYTVKAGDVAVLIARRFSITLTELAAANPNKQLDRIQPGDTLVIPPPSQGGTQTPPIPSPTGTTAKAGGSTTTPPVKTGATYTVQSGDTLVGIAKKLGIALATLQQLNPGVSASSLQVGQKLNIPKGTAAGPTTTKKP
jgi:LysM repeat protein